MTPAGTPKEIVALLHRETVKELKSPSVIEWSMQNGVDPAGSTPEEHVNLIWNDFKPMSQDGQGGLIHDQLSFIS